MSARDRLDLVELLARIADTGSLSAAARAVGVSQPSASRLLKGLETIVGATLVHRSPQKLTLTNAGERFLTSARRLVVGWDDALAEVRNERERLEGNLRVVVPVAAGQGLLAAIAARFLKAHPEVTIEWKLSDDAVDPIREGFDLWVRAGDMPTDDLVVRDLWRIERAIVACPTWDLAEHPAALCAKAVRVTTFVPTTVELTHRDGEVFTLRQDSAFMTDNLYAARSAVLEGVGYAILPIWAVQSRLRRGELVQLCPDWRPPRVTLSLAYPPTAGRPARLTAFLALLKAELTRAGGLGVAFLESTEAQTSISLVPGLGGE